MDAPQESRIYVVIVNWNLPEDTIACLRSLLDDGFSPAHILIVDNGSTDDSLSRIANAFSTPPQFMRSEHNRGFSGGNNLGIRRLLQEGAAWMWLLNNDTIVPPGTRVALEEAIDRHPDFALFSPLILYHDEPERIWSLGERRIPGTLLTRHAVRAERATVPLPQMVEVDSLTACALLVRRDVFERIGLLDEGYFMYGEDGDFCLRAGRAGFRLACWMTAHILHKVSRSSGEASPLGRRWRTKSMGRFYRLHGSRVQYPVHLLFTLVRTGIISLRDLLHGRAECARASWQGWREGWFGQLSPVKSAL